MIRIVRVLAPNPGVRTLEGTNTWIVGRDPSIVIDPGPEIAEHLDEVARTAGRVAHVLVTHDHPDHAPGAATFADRVSAPLSAVRLPRAAAIRDGDTFRAGSVEVVAVTTPGHTPDHVAFWIGSQRALFTGDAVLGRGTSVIDPPEGELVRYVASLRKMLALEPRTIHPGHGPLVADAGATLRGYLAHRDERERQILETLADGPFTIEALVERIYDGYPADVRPLAARSVLAHLLKLEAEARAERTGRGDDARWAASDPRTCARCGRPVRARARYCESCNLIVLQEGVVDAASTSRAGAAPTARAAAPEVELLAVEGDREPWVPLLLEADEPAALRRYLADGNLYEIRAEGSAAGVVLLIPDGATIEIKNLALAEGQRGRGIGRAAIERIAEIAREAGAERLLVGTSETSRGAITFYRSCGFVDAGRRVGFFDSYPEPVIDDGVQAHDMVLFTRTIGPRGTGAREPSR